MRYLLLGLLFFSFGLVAQNKSRSFSDIERINNRIKITVNDGEYYISAYTKKIVECSFIPNGQKQQSSSHAISVAPKQHLTLEVNRFRKVAYISTGEILVKVNFSPFKITYLHDGYQLISERWGYEKDGNLEKIQFNIDKDEILYGGGARALGMNRRGNRLQLYNRAHYGYEEKSVLMNYTIPMVLSNKRYAIHFDNPQIGALDFDSKGENMLTYETIGGRKVYQVIIGEDWKDLTKEYTYLTGRQPLPPRWMFGNFASRFGYHSEQEARNVVQKYKDEKIPLDAIIFDLYWFGKDIQGTLGNLTFYRDSFPNGEQMIFDFRKENVKTVLITEPFILTTSSKWKEAVEKEILAVDSLGKPYTYDFYFGNTGLIDLFKPNA
ncbi:MAG: TIM-barrel domain-containing protein, partial [Crocinitomicaceae bacterium]